MGADAGPGLPQPLVDTARPDDLGGLACVLLKAGAGGVSQKRTRQAPAVAALATQSSRHGTRRTIQPACHASADVSPAEPTLASAGPAVHSQAIASVRDVDQEAVAFHRCRE